LAVDLETDRALPAAEHLLERPLADAALLVLDLEGHADLGPGGSVASVPWPEGIHVGAAARDLPGEGQLDRALDRRLARLVRAMNDRQPARERDLELPVAADVAQGESGDPHRVTSWPARRSRPRRRTSRSSPASSSDEGDGSAS